MREHLTDFDMTCLTHVLGIDGWRYRVRVGRVPASLVFWSRSGATAEVNIRDMRGLTRHGVLKQIVAQLGNGW
jgi:hypothetical protein